ncbi:MAG: S8 family serine peptidase, partial [Planctomycetota bacterium]
MPRASRSFVPSVLVALAGLAGSLPAQVTERPPEPTPDADAKFREGRLAAAVRLRDAGHAHRGRLVLRGDATRAALDEIEACGVKIRGVSRDGRLDADLTGADLTALDETGLVATAGEHGFAERIDERLWDALAAPTGGRIKLFAHLHIGEDLDGALDRLRAMPGVSIAGVDREGLRHVVRIEAPESRVFGVADDNGIRWLEPAPVLTTRDANSRSIVQSGSVGQMPFDAFGLNGAGQIIGVIDTRPSASHCAFSDTVAIGPGHRKIVAYNASSGAHQHGTHVAALAVGDSGSADNVRGVAWGARMVFNTIPVFEEAQVRARFELHASQGAFVHNNSWGDDFVRTYTGLARAVDAFTYDNDEHVVLIATTNRSILYTPENAKNGVAVAATQNGNLSESFCLGGTGPTE